MPTALSKRPANSPGIIEFGQAAIITLGAFSTMLSSTLLNAALPTMSAALRASASSTQWIASGYLLALGAGVPISAWASRRLGPTRLWSSGLVLFAIASTVCALAPNFWSLIVGRILQGLAGGLIVPAGQTALGLIIPRERLGRIISTIGIAVVLAPTLGTSLGAVLLQQFGWPSLFWAPIPLCAAALIAAWRGLPTTQLEGGASLDWRGLMMISCGLPLLIFAFEARAKSDLGAVTYVAPIAGLLLLAGFVLRSCRVDEPLLNIRLLERRDFALASTLMALGGVVTFGAQILLPAYFEAVRREAPDAIGLLLTPQLFGTAVGFPFAGWLADRFGARVVLIAGGVLTTVASLPMTVFGKETSYVAIGLTIAVRGLAVALCTIPAMTAGLTIVDKQQLGDAAPILNIMQRLGAAAGTALCVAVVGTAAPPIYAEQQFHLGCWLLVAASSLVGLGAIAMREHPAQ